MNSSSVSLKFTFLGTADSAQVPVYNCTCAACARAHHDSAYVRTPCSALLQFSGQQWIIDSGRMDLAQLFPAPSLDGILQTHYHADHAQGLLHLRWGVDLRIPVWGPADPVGFADLYKHSGILDFSQPWVAFETRCINGLKVTALPLNHSRMCFGYLLESPTGSIAYLTDTVGLPVETYEWLAHQSLDYCIVDCSEPPRSQTPRNHNDVNMALAMCKELNIKKLVFTHIGHELDCWLMENQALLPKHVVIATDGMSIEV